MYRPSAITIYTVAP